MEELGIDFGSRTHTESLPPVCVPGCWALCLPPPFASMVASLLLPLRQVSLGLYPMHLQLQHHPPLQGWVHVCTTTLVYVLGCRAWKSHHLLDISSGMSYRNQILLFLFLSPPPHISKKSDHLPLCHPVLSLTLRPSALQACSPDFRF